MKCVFCSPMSCCKANSKPTHADRKSSTSVMRSSGMGVTVCQCYVFLYMFNTVFLNM